jgi:putative transcriptional regulator
VITVYAPTHHFDDDALLDFAAGTAAGALSLPLACHLPFCAQCRQRLGGVERLADAVAPVQRGRLAELRGRLLANLAAAPPPPEPPSLDGVLTSLGLPLALRAYLPAGRAPRWRRLVPGMRAIDLDLDPPGTRARVLGFRPGFVVPLHDHAGPECTVVLHGSYVDGEERFGPGDVALRGQGERHELRVDSREECVALIVARGRPVPLTLVGRLLQLGGSVWEAPGQKRGSGED